MSSIPQTTRVYASLFALVAGVAFSIALLRNGLIWSRDDIVLGSILFAMIVLVERFQVDVPSNSFHFSLSVGAILSLGGAFVLPPMQSAIVVMAAAVISDSLARLRPIQIFVNVINLGFATFLASLTYHFASGYAHSPLDSPRSLLATVIASAIYTVVNLGCLSVIVAPVVGETPLEMWKTNFSGSFVFINLPMFGSLVPITAVVHSWGILILIVPLTGAHMALRALRKVAVETQATIVSLTDALEFRDPYTHHHSARVTEYVIGILDQMPHLPSRVRLTTIDAARIHDVGKVGIRDTALLKDGKLTDAEYKDIQRHPVIGADIVQNLEMYRHGASLVRHHHERWDGRGYPDGLAGENIPLGARIIAVADSYDAMTSDRPYRRALSAEIAISEIERNSGVQFDPQVATAFIRSVAHLCEASPSRPSDGPSSSSSGSENAACTGAGPRRPALAGVSLFAHRFRAHRT